MCSGRPNTHSSACPIRQPPRRQHAPPSAQGGGAGRGWMRSTSKRRRRVRFAPFLSTNPFQNTLPFPKRIIVLVSKSTLPKRLFQCEIFFIIKILSSKIFILSYVQR